jgi:hypothetical protein
MGGGNPRRRTGAEPRLQSGAGMSSKKRHPGRKRSASKLQRQGSRSHQQGVAALIHSSLEYLPFGEKLCNGFRT